MLTPHPACFNNTTLTQTPNNIPSQFPPVLVPANSIDIDSKIAQMNEVFQYFRKITTYHTDIVHQLEESISSLQGLHQYLQHKYHYTLSFTFILSTLVVENFFSQIRCKIHYPSLVEFAYTMRRAKHEFIKSNATDYLFLMQAEQIGKKYNSQENVELQVSDIEFNNKNKRKQDIKIIYE
jgi:hypothetical protein